METFRAGCFGRDGNHDESSNESSSFKLPLIKAMGDCRVRVAGIVSILR